MGRKMEIKELFNYIWLAIVFIILGVISYYENIFPYFLVAIAVIGILAVVELFGNKWFFFDIAIGFVLIGCLYKIYIYGTLGNIESKLMIFTFLSIYLFNKLSIKINQKLNKSL